MLGSITLLIISTFGIRYLDSFFLNYKREIERDSALVFEALFE